MCLIITTNNEKISYLIKVKLIGVFNELWTLIIKTATEKSLENRSYTKVGNL